MKTKILFFLILGLLISCGDSKNKAKVDDDGAVEFKTSLIKGVDIDEVLGKRASLLADMSKIVPIEEIATALDLDASLIKKVPNIAKNSNTCFFKWDDPNFPNTGIMMEIKDNPYPHDLPEWSMVTMEALRRDGHNALGEDFSHKFKALKGMATEGLYNSDIGKYYWRLSDKVVLLLAFNTIHEQDEQFKIAMDLGSKMIKNYLEI